MARVKGSKQEHLIVRKHRPVRSFLFSLFGLSLVAFAVASSFYLGQRYQQDLQKLEPGQREQLKLLTEKVVALERDRLVDQVAVENAREALKRSEEEIADLTKAVAFYRSVMAPGTARKGLQLQNINVEQLGQRAYRVAWMVTQVGKNDKYVEGKTALQFVTLSGTEERVLSLEEVAAELPQLTFKLRYFQKFAAEVHLPEGLEMKTVKVTAESNGSKPQVVSSDYDWTVQEQTANVGE